MVSCFFYFYHQRLIVFSNLYVVTAHESEIYEKRVAEHKEFHNQQRLDFDAIIKEQKQRIEELEARVMFCFLFFCL